MKTREMSFLAVAFLIFLVAISIVLVQLRNTRVATRFRDDLVRIDAVLPEDPNAAALIIRRASQSATSATDWLSLSKRAYRVGIDLANEIALAALEAYPGNEAIAALAVHSAMRRGATDRAAEVAESHLSGDRFAAVKAEAYLRGGLLWEGEEGESAVVSRVVESEEPEDYLLAAKLTGQPDYLVDAALLYLRRGDLNRAAEVHAELPLEWAPFLGMRIAYDRDDAAEFERYLSHLIEAGGFDRRAQLLYADFALAHGDREEALAVYRELTDDPVAANNAAVLLYERDAEKALGILREVSDRALVEPFLAANHVRLLAALGEDGRAAERLEEYRESMPTNGLLAALDVAVKRRLEDPPARIVSRLWRLHVEVSDPAPIARYLTWYLFGMRDRSGVEELVTRDRYRRTAWARLYRSAYAAADGRIEQALNELGAGDDSWRIPYNRAIVLLRLDRHEEAIEALASSREQLERSCESCDGEMALILYRTASALAASGRTAEAAARAAEAVDLDPTLADAQHLLDSLES